MESATTKPTAARSAGTRNKASARLLAGVVIPGLFLLFAISGMCTAIYGLAWNHLLSNLFGGNLSQFTVYAAMMTGMAIGLSFWGKFIDLMPERALPVFSGLQAMAALSTVFIPLIPAFREFGGWFPGQSSWSPGYRTAVHYVLSFIMLLPVSFASGGLLPAIGDFLIQSQQKFGRYTALLFGLNMLGLAAGAGLAHTVLAGEIGLADTVRLGGYAGLAISLLMLMVDAIQRRTGPLQFSGPGWLNTRHVVSRLPSPKSFHLAVIGLYLTGFCILAHFILWARLLLFQLDGSVYASAIVFTFLTGALALGSLLVAPVIRNLGTPLFGFAMMEIAIGVFGYLAPYLIASPELRPETPYWAALLSRLQPGILIPAALLGAVIPLGAEIYQARKGGFAASLGSVFVKLSIGGIAAALAMELFIIPQGFRNAIIIVSAVNLAAGGLILTGWLRRTPAIMTALALAGIIIAAMVQTPEDYLNQVYRLLKPGAQLVDVQEGPRLTSLVFKQQNQLYLYRGSTLELSGSADGRKAISLAAALPLLLQDESGPAFVSPDEADTASKILLTLSDRVASVDVSGFRPSSPDSLKPPPGRESDAPGRLSREQDDAAHYLAGTDHSFAAIVSAAGHPWTVADHALYSDEFYRLVRMKLKPTGVFSQVVSLDGLQPGSLETVVNTTLKTFPHLSLWQAGGSSVVLLATPEKLRLNYSTLENKLMNADVRKALQPAGLDDPVEILACFATGERHLTRLTDIRRPVASLNTSRTLFFPLDTTIAQKTAWKKNSAVNISGIRESVADYLELDGLSGQDAETLLTIIRLREQQTAKN